MADEPKRQRQSEAPQRKLIPTPPIGTPVVWYKCGDKRFPVPAVILLQNTSNPGHCDLSICIGSGWLRQPNVTWAGDPKWSDANSAQVRNNGTWDKLPWYTFGPIDYAPHEELLRRQEIASLQAATAAKQRQEEFAAMATQEPNTVAVEVARAQAQMILNGV